MSGLPTLSPLLKVGCSTRPDKRLLMLVRTKAEPFPGLTCWNSMISKGSPSTSIFKPLRNSEVSMTPAMGGAPEPEPSWIGKGLQLGADARRGDAQRVAALAVVAARGESPDQEVVRADQAHDGQHLVGGDAHLVHRSGLEELGGVLGLGRGGRILHP